MASPSRSRHPRFPAGRQGIAGPAVPEAGGRGGRPVATPSEGDEHVRCPNPSPRRTRPLTLPVGRPSLETRDKTGNGPRAHAPSSSHRLPGVLGGSEARPSRWFPAAPPRRWGRGGAGVKGGAGLGSREGWARGRWRKCRPKGGGGPGEAGGEPEVARARPRLPLITSGTLDPAPDLCPGFSTEGSSRWARSRHRATETPRPRAEWARGSG